MSSSIHRFESSEYQRITQLLGREPSDIEQTLFMALWSEHCSYKSSKIHLKKLFQKSKRVISSFGENAGVVDLGEGEKIAFKMESHNHPSRLVPFHGAATGVGGVLRDIFAMNARPICLSNYLCFGDIQKSQTPGLLDGVVRGIGGYGNCIGLPTITGQTSFHSSYNENILVNALAVGVYGPLNDIVTSALKEFGSYVVYVGARTGRDGIHGAQMASQSFGHKFKDIPQSTVQVGDPFYGKLLMEACLEVMNEKLVNACQDMGAAGLISSSFEMASKGNLGMTLHLDRVPLRDSTMKADEILLSETQERMLLTCSPQNYPKIEQIFQKWSLPVCILGEVIQERKMKLYFKDQLLTDIDPHWFTEKAPEYQREYQVWSFPNKVKNVQSSSSKEDSNVLIKILQSSHGCSREFIFNQYDQRVGAGTAGDCSFPIGIIRLPISQRFLALALGGRPHILKTDAFVGGQDAIFYPSLKMACRGFEPLAATDCLNFGNPKNQEVMSQFVASIEGMAEACQELEVPIISGNVSFYNESTEGNIIPTSATGLIGISQNANWPRNFFEKEEEKIYLIHCHQCIFSGLHAQLNSKPEVFSGQLNLSALNTWLHKIISISQSKEVTSSKVVGRAGLAYTLSKMIFKKKMGAWIQTSFHPFEERLYEVIFTILRGYEKEFEEKLRQLSLEYEVIGQTNRNSFSYNKTIQLSLDQMAQSYQTSLF